MTPEQTFHLIGIAATLACAFACIAAWLASEYQANRKPRLRSRPRRNAKSETRPIFSTKIIGGKNSD